MNDLDEVLAKLRSAEAPDGMEARILARLNDRTANVDRPMLGVGWWFGGLAAVAALLLAVAVKEIRRPVAPAHVARESVPQGLKPEVSPARDRTAEAVGLVRPKRLRSQAVLHSKTVRAAAPRVESFPAPPEPLTAQERLLIRVAHSGDREDFNLLNLETFELAMAADKADFDAFLRAEGAKPRP